ncbi:MAG TPA: Spy/CpxP family protein refolding chaperone [Pyrinomonadaceae bacterium]|jgi:Spy/CpxP family protein refolding chaperone
MNKAFGKQATHLAAAALSLLLLVWAQAPPARAQSDDPPQQNPAQQNEDERRARPPRDLRRDPLRALNLTPDQLQQIRAIREESKEEWRATRQRVAEAHRALDEVIYSDNGSEALIEERARAVGAAQAAVARLRALTELKIRRVLTAEQLSTLRSMRQQALDAERKRVPRNSFGSRRQRPERFGQRDGVPPGGRP